MSNDNPWGAGQAPGPQFQPTSPSGQPAPGDQAGHSPQIGHHPLPGQAPYPGQQAMPYYPGMPDPASRPGSIYLNPMRVTDVFDGLVRAVRANPVTILCFMLPYFVVMGALTWFFVNQMGEVLPVLLDWAQSPSREFDATMMNAVGSIFGAGLVLGLLTEGGTYVGTALLCYPFAMAAIAKKPSMGEVWQRTAFAIIRVVGLFLLLNVVYLVAFGAVVGLVFVLQPALDWPGAIGVAILLGLILSVLAIVLYVRLYLCIPAIVLERQGIFASLGRASRLSKARFWPLVGGLVLCIILLGVLNIPSQILSQLLGQGVGLQDLPALMQTLAVAGGLTTVLTVLHCVVMAGVFTYQYLDCRMRFEGYGPVLQQMVHAPLPPLGQPVMPHLVAVPGAPVPPAGPPPGATTFPPPAG